jgi:Tol biopolymer transport system component
MYETDGSLIRRIMAVVAALLVASGGLLVPSGRPAEAAFPGSNGKIVFQGERRTGVGVDNPQGDFEIFTMNPDGTGLTQLTHNDTPDTEPAYSPYGNKIVFVRGADIWAMRTDGTQQTNLTPKVIPGSSYDHDPAFPPVGKKVAFSRASYGNDSEVYVIDSDGSDPKNLSKTPGSDYGPVFSPNGARIAFTSNRNGDEEIYKMRADGSGTPIKLTNNRVPDEQPDFSPDGKRIAYSGLRTGNEEILTMRADGTDKIRLTRTAYDEDAPAYSPEGKRIVYGAGGSIAKMKTDGTQQIFLPHGDHVDLRPNWQPLKVLPFPL